MSCGCYLLVLAVASGGASVLTMASDPALRQGSPANSSVSSTRSNVLVSLLFAMPWCYLCAYTVMPPFLRFSLQPSRDKALLLSRVTQCLRNRRPRFARKGFASLLASRLPTKQNHIQWEPRPAGRLAPPKKKQIDPACRVRVTLR